MHELFTCSVLTVLVSVHVCVKSCITGYCTCYHQGPCYLTIRYVVCISNTLVHIQYTSAFCWCVDVTMVRQLDVSVNGSVPCCCLLSKVLVHY
jgi:hypothetical protein